jgi:hypothetical protein
MGVMPKNNSDWFDDRYKRIPRLSRCTIPLPGWMGLLYKIQILKPGWDGYDAPIPTRLAIEIARDYLFIADQLRFPPRRIEASVMGGVGITYRKDNRKVYLEFYNDGTAHSLFSDRSGRMHTMAVKPDDDEFKGFVEKAKDYLDGRDTGSCHA